jgi:hypothetical protein
MVASKMLVRAVIGTEDGDLLSRAEAFRPVTCWRARSGWVFYDIDTSNHVAILDTGNVHYCHAEGCVPVLMDGIGAKLD